MADLPETTAERVALLARLAAALANDGDLDAADALAQQKVATEELYSKLVEADHMRTVHGAAAAQEAIRHLNEYRDAFELEARAAFAIAKTATMEEFVTSLRYAMTPHIHRALTRLREIEAANGQAGWCIHQKPKGAPNGWTATREGTTVRLALVRPSNG